MKINKTIFIFVFVLMVLSISAVSASNVTQNDTDVLNDVGDSGDDINAIYVDTHGKGSGDGSQKSPINSLKKAISKAEENATLYLASGEYKSVLNTKLTISKSLNFVGSDNTIINGQNLNFIFDIQDGVTVSFKNIRFINSYKAPESYSASYNNKVYGASLDIKNATVRIEGCSFENNVLTYGSRDNYVYGGAISNFGDLTIINSKFINNTALSTSGLYSYGGNVYNKGKLSIYNSTFKDAKSVDFGYGAAIANDGELLMENSTISNSRALHECRGSAIYNTGDFKLFDSIIENNYIERANFNGIYGVIYNSGTLTARGTVFRNNTGYYESPTPSYKGSPNIYNNGNLNITYCAFMDNNHFDGISTDIYFNGGDVISLDNNWWNTNENPYSTGLKINVDRINSWLIFNVTPDYSKLNISDSVTINAAWTNNINLLPQINLIPKFDVTFKTTVDGKDIVENKQLNGSCDFIFNYTQNKGAYDVAASLGSFTQNVIVDVGKTLSYVEFSLNNNITYLENLTVNVEVTGADGGAPTGNVSLTIDGEIYTVSLANGKGSHQISGLKPGKYDLDIIYEGNDNYFKAFNKTSVEIQKQDVNLEINIPEIKVGQKGSFVVTLTPNGVQGQAIVYVDGVRKKIVYLYNGDTTISLSNFAEGEYNITLQFVETDYYNPATVSGILNVTRYDSAIEISSNDINVGQNATVTIKVTPDSLRGEATLIINGISETIFIDDAITNVTISNLAAGEYNVTVIFDGDLRYYAVNDSTSFKILRTPVVLDVDIAEDEKNLNGTVTVNVNNANCTGEVGVYINYNLYKANLTNGKAQFNVKFDKGTNYIFAFYEGNRYFEDATWNTTIGVADEFVFIGQNSTGFEGNDFNYTVRLIEVNGIAMPNRIVSVDLNGKKYNITTNNDGYAYLKLNLANGQYVVSATYKNSTISNTLAVRPIQFNLTSTSITYGENLTFSAIFENGVAGKVNFIAGDLNVIVDVVNGSALYICDDLDVGNYTLRAIYSNDFVNLTQTDEFEVKKADLEFTVNVSPATPFVDEIITVSDLARASGNLIFIFNETEYVIPIIDSQAVLNMSLLSEGNYSLVVEFDGDNNYHASKRTVSFYVKQRSSDIALTTADAAYGKDIIITAVLNDNATGIVRFNVANLTEDIEIVGGKAIWNFTGVDVGDYNVTACYLGNDYYISSENSTDFKVFKANSTIELYVKEVYLNENIRIYADLSPNATGNLSFSMIGYFSPRNKPIVNSASNWYIAPLNTGQYTVIARYAGDKNYYASSTTYLLNVSQKKSVMEVELNDAGLNDRVMCKVSLNSRDGDAISSTVTLRIGSSTYDIDVVEGKGSLVIGKLAIGRYDYTVDYAGDDDYTSASSSGSFKVVDDLLDVNLTVTDFTKYYNGSEMFKVTLKDSNNNPFAYQYIVVKIGQTEHDLITDSNGEAFLAINLNSGNYTAFINYYGNERFHPASANASVVVLPTVEGIDVVKLYGSGTQYFAVFVDTNGKALGNTNVTFKIKSKSYTISTLPNGVARMNINLKAGTYRITSYNPVTGEKLTNKITIYYSITENKDVSNYYGAKTNYKVRISSENGKPVGAGKVVTFKVNGKTYKVKTDKNGYAKLAISLSPKKYTVTATYNGFKVSNKITVKNVLSAKSISKKKSKTTKFSAKLVNSKGKALSGKKITFKINGKTFSAKTNSKGIATVTIKINLGVGKHKIQSIYGKSKITNTIVVKK